MAEWLIAAVLKTAWAQTHGGSNPPPSALFSPVSNSGVATQTYPKFFGGSPVMRRPVANPAESLFTRSQAGQAQQAGGGLVGVSWTPGRCQ